MNPTTVIEFWFTPPLSEHWFNATPAIDECIKQQFESLWQRAANGELDTWNTTPIGCLALCIILDQFPLNMYRGHPKSFSTEQAAVAVCKHAIQHGFDKQLPYNQVAFLYMPLMHSENINDQAHSVELFEAANLPDNARFARHHQHIIETFGRFPHRNAILGRNSSTAEEAYLASPAAFKG